MRRTKYVFTRVWHPVHTWEEVTYNMWGMVPDRAKALEEAITLTADAQKYGHYMRRVVKEWPISCENALTDNALNKRAWIGHAAVALALKCPEDITRKAWGVLTDEQRILANAEATAAISEWEHHYTKNNAVYYGLGTQMLFQWDT